MDDGSDAFSRSGPNLWGRQLTDLGPIDPETIRTVGFLISNKQQGEFRLEVDWITPYRDAAMGEPVTRTDAEWRGMLTPLQYKVTRERGTERAFTGEYHDHGADGVYTCIGCSNPVFSSVAKFETETGWPSHYVPLAEAATEEAVDQSLGLVRTEVRCARCGSHLGMSSRMARRQRAYVTPSTRRPLNSGQRPSRHSARQAVLFCRGQRVDYCSRQPLQQQSLPIGTVVSCISPGLSIRRQQGVTFRIA